jgi:hypothetical protein
MAWLSTLTLAKTACGNSTNGAAASGDYGSENVRLTIVTCICN